MKRKQFFLLLAASLVALSAGACGTDSTTPSGQETPDTSLADNKADTDAENADENPNDTENTESAENAEESDTTVINDGTGKSDESAAASPVSVTFQKTHDEIKADDGTLILTLDMSMPVVAIESAEEIAAKINTDIEAYYATASSGDDDTTEWAKSDYEDSKADENGGWFPSYGYSESLTASVTRADDKVLSLELTSYSYTGGAHGNYGSIGKNYDLRTGEVIGLEALSEDYAAFHATALDYIVNQAASPAYKDRLFGPSKNDLDSALFEQGTWVFTQSGLSFMSDPYVLGPYASGEIYFRIPYARAHEIGLKEDYRYNGNFTEERYYINRYDPETMEPVVDSTPDYSFDLNGDGVNEQLAFHGNDSYQYVYYIDGKDWGKVIEEQIDGSNSYLDTSYALYDIDPSDGLTEIAVLYTEFQDGGADEGSTGSKEYSCLFRYTADKELQFLEKRDGFVTRPDMPQ